MKIIKNRAIVCLTLLAILAMVQTAYADKSSVTISAPETVSRGTEVTVRLTVTHSGNNFFHYTNWVIFKVNGKEFSRWDFTSKNRAEDSSFVREAKILVGEPIELVAEANCNLHGSKGPAKHAIAVKE
jgi:desulfoferrodoxin (superoxide reductase-like protein)